MNMYMKKLWCLMFVFSFVLGLSAQTKMRVWIKGSVTDYPVAIIDSITFFEDVEGAFSVDVNKKVVFSKGNLQYHPTNNEWRFAEFQTDCIGGANDNISDTFDGWIDLFGWGTGSNPTNISGGGETYIFTDWGINQIGNYTPYTWRTLTDKEWHYLRYERNNAERLIGVAQINEVNGLILLPDDWTCPEGVGFQAGFHTERDDTYYAAYQKISHSDWSKMEQAGAIFLPAAGSRYVSQTDLVQFYGCYWTASLYNDYSACIFQFFSNGADIDNLNRSMGLSARLVREL